MKKMIKLYGIFHLPTGELMTKKIFLKRGFANNRLQYIIESMNSGIIIKDDKWFHSEVREVKYKMGSE